MYYCENCKKGWTGDEKKCPTCGKEDCVVRKSEEDLKCVCPKCGDVTWAKAGEKEECIYCHTECICTHRTMWESIYEAEEHGYSDAAEYLRTLFYYDNPLRDEEAEQFRKGLPARVAMHEAKKKAEANSHGMVKCPACGSTSVSKISNTAKVAKVSFFGLFGAGDLGKTYRCSACGCKF